MTPLLWRLAILATIFITGFGGGVAVTRNHYRPIITDMKLKTAVERQTAAEVVTKAVQDNAKLVIQLEVNHAAANDALNVLLSHPIGRVQLPSTTCPASNQVATATGGAIQTPSTERASDTSQTTLDGFIKDLEADSGEWSRALNACSVVMEWAKLQ